jgi:creatinine amidohydrolase
MAEPEIRWHKLRRDRVAAAAAAGGIPLLPIGSIEQHGPHLPLDTDTDAATAVCEAAARRLAEAGEPTALVLPPIWWGLSPYWLGFPGTLTLRPETILALVSDLGRSVARHGFARLVIVNGHGGNAGIVGVAATLLADHGLRAVALSYWELIAADVPTLAPRDRGVGHAGEFETAIALHRQPDLVARDAIAPDLGADLPAMLAAPFAAVGYAPPDPAREAPSGVYGQAAAGRREQGEVTIDLAAERLAAFVRRLATS